MHCWHPEVIHPHFLPAHARKIKKNKNHVMFISCLKLRGNYYSFWGQFCKNFCRVRHRPDEFTCLIACKRRNSITSIRVHQSEKCASCGRAPQFALFRTARAPHQKKRIECPIHFSLYGARASVEWGDVSRDKKRLFNHNLITRGPLS